MPGSRKFQNEIKKIWSATNGTKYVPANGFIENLTRAQSKANSKTLNSSVKNWIALTDEFLLFLLNAYILCWLRVADSKPRLSLAQITTTLLCGAIVSHLFAIRTLVLRGFDMNARATARLLSEYIDIFNLLQMEPGLVNEFHAAQELEDSNAFWRKYIAKGKLRSRVRSTAMNRFPNLHDFFGDIDRFRATEYKVISAASHPSLVGAAAAMMLGHLNKKAGFGLFGQVDPASVRTLTFVFFCLFEFLVVNDRLEFLKFALDHQPSNPSSKYISERHSFLFQLSIFVATHEKSSFLSHPPLPTAEDV
jgi:hypothetical protein